MGAASEYWQIVKLEVANKHRVRDLPPARLFFQQHFDEWLELPTFPHPQVQHQLFGWLRSTLQMLADTPSTGFDQEQFDPAKGRDAERCLRCFVSHRVEQVCLGLVQRFGQQHGFHISDLLPYVLDDDGEPVLTQGIPSPYQSFATRVLQTFDETRSQLATWVTRMVRHQRELNLFLLEQGVYLVTDWGILNDTTPRQVQRILTEFHHFTIEEVEAAVRLLTAYHEVYRQDRLQMRRGGGQRQCLPPTVEQLSRIAQVLSAGQAKLSQPEQVLHQLQKLATELRQYRIHARGGRMPAESLDRPEMQSVAAEIEASPATDETIEAQEQFLKFYQEQFVGSLDAALEQVLGQRLNVLQRKSAAAAEQLVMALHLFHCEGQSMTQIAEPMGLQAQYQVTRLLKLKELRADVRRQLLIHLRDRVQTKAREYLEADHPLQLQQIDQQIEAALNELIDSQMQKAQVEASVAQNKPQTNLFARRLCHYLKSCRTKVS